MRKAIIASLCTAIVAGSASAADWTENVKVKGDLRYRHEALDTDNDARDARHRQRLRARLGIEGKVSDAATIYIQLASGSDDPISTNQTLDDAFSKKFFSLDMAYFTLSPAKFDGLTLAAGKMKNPFIIPGQSELIWDSDLTPEGGALLFDRDFDNITLSLVGSGLWIDERSTSDDSWLGAAQAAARFHFNEKKSAVRVGGSLFQYVNAEGFPLFYDESDPAGNTAVEVVDDEETLLVYANDYELIELFAEVTHHLGDIPVTLAGDFVTNTAPDSLDTGWLLGAWVNKLKDPGSWEFRYIYRELEKDALVGAFTDSDFREGGTDAKGHEFGVGYQIDKNLAFAGTYFLNTVNIADSEDDDEFDFNRLQLDLQLKF